MSQTSTRGLEGAVPPLRARTLIVGAAVGLAVLVAAVLLLVPRVGPQDESSYADQRNGLLADGPSVPPSLDGIDFGGQVSALLFVRARPSSALVAGWHAALPAAVRAWVVVQAGAQEQATPVGERPARVAGLPVVLDAGQVLSRAVGLPRPNDGAPGVGYAVVDRQRQVRYSTLDPNWPSNGFEVATISGALL